MIDNNLIGVNPTPDVDVQELARAKVADAVAALTKCFKGSDIMCVDLAAGISREIQKFGEITEQVNRDATSRVLQHLFLNDYTNCDSDVTVTRESVDAAVAVLSAAFKCDPHYAWSWHCNIAMPLQDAGVGVMLSNPIAAAIMLDLFGVDTSLNEHYAQVQQNRKDAEWNAAAERILGLSGVEESPFVPAPYNAKLKFPERTVAVSGSFAIVVDDGCYVLKNLMDDADGGHWKASPYWFEDALKVLADLPRNPREATFMRSQNQTYLYSVEDLISSGMSPLPLEVIPNHMGINLCSVDSIGWEKQDDGQLVSLTISFTPAVGEPSVGDNTYAIEEEQESNSVRHAKREFLALGYKPIAECEEGPDKWVQQNVLELLGVFAEQGHSGFSAPWVISMFSKLANHEPLCPLTGEDHEWNDTTEYGSSLTSFQNLRCSRVFKDGDGRAYDIYGIVFEHAPGTKNEGSCFTGTFSVDGIKYSSRVDVVFPYTPVKKTVLVDDEGTPLDHAANLAKMNAGVDATPHDTVANIIAHDNP